MSDLAPPPLLCLQYNKPSSTIVDSGTTDTSLPLIMQGAFLKAFKAATNHRLTYSTTKAIGSLTTPFGPDSSLLPDIVFVFSNGVEQRMPPSSYLDCPPQSAVKGVSRKTMQSHHSPRSEA